MSLPPPVGAVFAALAASALLLASAPEARAQDPIDPKVFSRLIERLGEESVELLSDADLSSEKRTRKFIALFSKSFDVDALSSFVIGRHWRTAPPEQKEAFRSVLPEVLGRRFVPLFEGRDLSDVDWHVAEVIPDEARPIIAEARVPIRLSDGRVVDTRWRGYRRNDGRVVLLDVKTEGVSLGLTLREEYGAIVQRSGLDGLTALLRENLDSSL